MQTWAIPIFLHLPDKFWSTKEDIRNFPQRNCKTFRKNLMIAVPKDGLTG